MFRRRPRDSRGYRPPLPHQAPLDDPFPDGAVDDGALDWLPPRPAPPPPRPAPRPGWQAQMEEVAAAMRAPRAAWPEGRELHYVISVPDSYGTTVAIDVGCRQRRKRDGQWRRIASFHVSPFEIEALPDPEDRVILAALSGGGLDYARSPFAGYFVQYHVAAPLVAELVERVVRTGRAAVRASLDQVHGTPVTWDDGPPWEFRLEVRASEGARLYRVTGALARGDATVALDTPLFLHPGGIAVFADRVARLDDGGAFPWIAHLRGAHALRVPAMHAGQFLAALFRMPVTPRHSLPPELAYERVETAPRPRLRVTRPVTAPPDGVLRAELTFDYDGTQVAPDAAPAAVFEAERRRLIVRAPDAERAARERLAALGVRPRYLGTEYGPGLDARHLPRVARALLAEGWHVEAEGRLYRQPRALRMAVASGIDWFELHATAEFDGASAPLPALLRALRRGERTVRLDDGSEGVLPEEWLRRYALVANLGTVEGDHLRFTRRQVGLLDALLAAQPEIAVDERFARARAELARFEGVAPADPPPGFVGTLRGYQREALGWLYFLQRFGLGGCLADDMGLGKTVMVLALLASRRTEGAKKPSLVVVPRSLVFNWKEEAARFAPGLSVLDHTGAGRWPEGRHFGDHDLVLTTYGTLRRDIVHLRDVDFDYVVLDEAQAIKNAATDAAKAVRLLRADHRLALSGTPVENHLGELWSLFEFLDPGMLGAGGPPDGWRDPDEETVALLSRALRPLILRRTKAQVAPELPPRTEQTVYCELEPRQRRLYDELRDHYRASLLGRVARDGIARSALVILEALLRLRQAACHPGLIDPARAGEPAGKLDVLLPRLHEVLAEGHKALVFSQFTSLLAIVRARLDRERVPYEYLDGATRDRRARVARFQEDPGCRVFLVSLKAGGLGLNLTAAEHVFLLDPWWNPAVEAQAIDRAHRIGQRRPVLAFRIIARDTVEERILALQARKRGLAEAIITERNSLIRSLTREDLDQLLS